MGLWMGLALAVATFALPAVASADTAYTVTNAGDPSTGASCPSSTECTLRAALTDAELQTGNVSISLAPNTTYTVTRGSEPALYDQTDTATFTIIGGTGTVINLAGNGDNLFLNPRQPTMLADVTISGAAATSTDVIDGSTGAQLTVEQVTFANDDALGEIFTESGLTADSDTFTDDTDAEGAIYISDGASGPLSLSSISFANEQGEAFADADDVNDPVVINGLTVTGGGSTGEALPPSVDIEPAAPATATVTGLDVEGVDDVGAPTVVRLGRVSVAGLTVAHDTSAGPAVVDDDPGTAYGDNWTVADNTNTAGATTPGGGIAVG